MGLTQFIRTKPDLDKAGIMAALARCEGCDASLAGLLDTTFEAKQTDEFFIDTGLDEAAVRRELDGTIS